MISVVVGSILGAVFLVFFFAVARPYGAARVSELPGLFCIMLAGRDARQEARLIMAKREQRL